MLVRLLEFTICSGPEATAGIEPAMKVLQIVGSIREPRPEKRRKVKKSRPLTDPPGTPDLCLTPLGIAMPRRAGAPNEVNRNLTTKSI
jgi:hypothetical protein